MVQKLEELQDSAPSGDGTGGDASEPEQQGLEAMQADSDEDSGKAQAEARLLLENAKRSLTTMRKDAASGVTQRVREAIQSRIQLIQTDALVICNLYPISWPCNLSTLKLVLVICNLYPITWPCNLWLEICT